MTKHILGLALLLAGCAEPRHDTPRVVDTGACEVELAEVVPVEVIEEPPPFQDWPIQWTPLRAELTSAYLSHHRGADRVTGDPEVDSTQEPRVVVLHWTAGPTAKSAWHTFDPEKTTSRRKLEKHQLVNLSAHFVVDRDGTAYRLLDETRVGRHTIGLNHLSIGIENVGDGKKWPLTDAQRETNVRLVRWLAARYPITHLIGHREYREMERHPYFEETDPKFRTQREDPGVDFLAAVRAEVADLGLQGPPSGDDVVATSMTTPRDSLP